MVYFLYDICDGHLINAVSVGIISNSESSPLYLSVCFIQIGPIILLLSCVVNPNNSMLQYALNIK